MEAVGTYEDVLSATYTPSNNYNIILNKGDFTIHCRNIVEPTNWPANLTNQNNCFANADTIGLKDASEIQTLFASCNPVTNANEITVTAQDNATATRDCDWTWTRTFNISITGGCASTTKTMSVSGGDRNKPSFTVPVAKTVCPNTDGSYNIDPTVTGNVSNLSDDCHSAAQLTIDYSDSEPELLPSGKRQIIRTWTVTDACGNDSVQTQTITINPQVELTLTNATQTIFVGDPMEPVQVSYNYGSLTYSTLPDGLSYNSTSNVLSGTLTEVGEYSLPSRQAATRLPTAAANRKPSTSRWNA